MGNFVCGTSTIKKKVIELEIYSNEYIDETIDFDDCCSLCMIYKQNEETICKQCKYTSCAECAINWIKANKYNYKKLSPCPICRQQLWCFNFDHLYKVRRFKHKHIDNIEHRIIPFSPEI